MVLSRAIPGWINLSSSDCLFRGAVKAAKTDTAPIELLVENADYYRAYKLNYHGGERYPHLERIAGRPDLLSEITKSHAPRVAALTER